MTIAALFVAPFGPYADRPGVDAWTEERDARLYEGPWSVVAHPPCARWGRYWHGGPSARVRRVKGDDRGCFAAALTAVRRWGGVLEHPEASSAWSWFALNLPPRSGGWVSADLYGGMTCCVEQGHYGHRARKATWLYACAVDLPELRWEESSARIGQSSHGKRAIRTGACQRMGKRERLLTPPAFAEVLIDIASRGVGVGVAAYHDAARCELERIERVQSSAPWQPRALFRTGR